MHTNDWLQLGLFIGLLAALTKPLGIYLTASSAEFVC